METRTTKRIRHIFNKEELYHAFAYRDEYSICRGKSTPMTAIYDFLFAGQHDAVKHITSKSEACDLIRGKLYSYFDWSKYCIAVINRKDKVLVVSDEYLGHKWNLECSLPNKSEWLILIHHGHITNPNIAKSNYRKQLIRKYFEYLIVRYVSSVLYKFRLAYTNVNYCGKYNENNTYDNRIIQNIANAVDFFKPSKTLLNTHIVDSYKEVYYYGAYSWSKDDTIRLSKKQIPTINQILNNKLFDEEHQLIYDKKMFYSRYCRGTRVRFTYKEVNNLYNTKVYNDKLIRKITNIDGGKIAKWYNALPKKYKPTWHQIIKNFYKDFQATIDNTNKINRTKSLNNKKEAEIKLAKINKSNNIVDVWRKGNSYKRATITYNTWIDSTIRHAGYWESVELYGLTFNNTQLRLNDDNTIATSRYCHVPLHDAIRLYKLFITDTTKESVVKDINNKDNITINFENFNITCGNYKLNWFKYTNKVTDANIPLNYKEWCVCIGCHHIWIDDFIDFVHYYHLEKDFCIK